jgi:spore maturation protein CgeB
MKILYLGTLEWGSTSLQRFDALRALPLKVYGVDLRLYQGEYVRRSSWKRIQIRFGLRSLSQKVGNEAVLEALRYQPDILWVDQGSCLPAWALSRIREETRALLIHYTPDSLKAPGWNNPCFRQAVSEYDLCFTTKIQDEEIYRSMGVRRLHFVLKGFDPDIHRPLKLTHEDLEKYSCDVGFSGQRMEARANSLCYLINNVQCQLHLYGRHWEKGNTGPQLRSSQKGWVYGEDYAKAIIGAKISLAFLNQEVGDVFTTRSFEIPACGGFMLAERTKIHQDLFKEGEEAVFFANDDELVEKVRYYLSHEEERLRIARAGFEKISKGKYRWDEGMREYIEICNRMIAGNSSNPTGKPPALQGSFNCVEPCEGGE